MPRLITEEDAVGTMRAAGLEPLEPHPGSSKPWRCRCDGCGKEVSPQHHNVQRGQGGCRFCAPNAALDPDEAKATMREHGLEPLDLYPGACKPWRCRCLTCEREVRPLYSSIQQGQGGCRFCARQAVDPEEAKSVMQAKGLEPLEPYPGSAKPWRCRHTCGQEVSPSYSSIRWGNNGPCRFCARLVVDPKEAEAAMWKKGLEPLEDYTRADKPWLCRCHTCGQVVSPRYDDVKERDGGCRFCTPRGYNPDRPSCIYLIRLPGRPGSSDGIIKVGIAGCHSDRLAQFQKRGWAEIESLRFEDGAIPPVIERAVLKWLTDDLGQPCGLSPGEMKGMAGHTETFSVGDLGAAGVTVDDVVDRLHQEAAKHSEAAAATGPEVPAQVGGMRLGPLPHHRLTRLGI
jgi:hypothetical protein